MGEAFIYQKIMVLSDLSFGFLGCLGALLGCLGALLGLSWALLGLSWALLGLSWALLWPSWTLLGFLGLSWGSLGLSWDSFGALFGFLGFSLVLSWVRAFLELSWLAKHEQTPANLSEPDFPRTFAIVNLRL